MATKKSKILIIGATGKLGKYLVEASLKAGHPTFLLVRESTASDPAKSAAVQRFRDLGAVLIRGDIDDHESLVKAVKLADVVISSLGWPRISDQAKVVKAILEAGNVKRFIPSEFGCDVDRACFKTGPAKEFLRRKVNMRRYVEAQGVPHTYVCCYGFAGFYLPTLAQENATAAPRDKITILGDGNAKTTFAAEQDIASYTVKAVDDPRTLNRTLYVIPPKNKLSFNELVSMWEKKIGTKLQRHYIPEEELVKDIQESSLPRVFTLSLKHYALVNGLEDELAMRLPSDLEATEMYPDVKYTTVEDYLDRRVRKETSYPRRSPAKGTITQDPGCNSSDFLYPSFLPESLQLYWHPCEHD